MTEFKYSSKQVGDTIYMALEGSIDEEAKLPSLDLATVKKAVIDLNGVRGINSIGIREWLEWIRPISQSVELTFERCPKSIVLQFNMVSGFLPPKARVSSFYLPYYCDKCDYEGSHLVKVGENVVKGPKGAVVTFDAKAAVQCREADCEIAMTSAATRTLDQISKSIKE